MNVSKPLVAAALSLAGALAAGAAQARTPVDVQWSVSIGGPVGVSVYSQPQPVYMPQPVYAPVPVVVQRPVHAPAYQDRDRDGIPNRYDRVYNPRWDRDGDGIPNRYDRQPNRARGGYHDSYADATPNRRDNRGGQRDDRRGGRD